MTSIYQACMGSDFARLHPQIQKRFGFSSEDQIASIGRGVMDTVWHGPRYVLPFLYIGTWRNIMFPVRGRDVPFTIENYAYVDSFGRETVTWIRKFQFPQKTRRFDATMIFSDARNRIVDYLGTHQHLAVDIDISVAENGGVRLRSGDQRFYERYLGFRFPMFISGCADVCEWFDEKERKFKIEVAVRNRWFGDLFGYRGSFDVTYVDGSAVPHDLKPLREEVRE